RARGLAQGEERRFAQPLQKAEEEAGRPKIPAKGLPGQWQAEKTAVQQLGALREQIEQTKIEIERAERSADYAKAAELKYGKLHELERQLKAEQDRLADKQGAAQLIKEEVDEQDIAEVISRWTHIPVEKLLEG